MTDELHELKDRARAHMVPLLADVNGAGIEIDANGANRLTAFVDAVLDVGRTLNLVSRRQLGELVPNHVAPSLTPLLAEADWGAPPTMLDVGSGGGFPGAVLAAVRPEWTITLTDSLAKKARFLETATASFDNVTVRRARVEELGRGDAETPTYSLITSRAVATVDVVWPWVSRLLKPEGECHVYVRRDALGEEAERAARAAGSAADVIEPLEPTWCGGAVLRLRRR